MTIQAGSRLGPYEIVAPLGAGGMGEVYKARDTRLDREARTFSTSYLKTEDLPRRVVVAECRAEHNPRDV